MPMFFLSEADVAILREVVAIHRNRRNRVSLGQAPEVDWPFAGGCNVAYVGPDGIPALSRGSDTGTGTGTSVLDDVVGSAICDVYQIDDDSLTPHPKALESSEVVYNLSTTAVPASSWVPIVRTNFGHWLVVGVGVSGGGEGSGTSISVKETGGLGLITGVEVIEVDPDDGFEIQTSGTTAKFVLNGATTLVAGSVTTGAQDWAGDKTLDGILTLYGGAVYTNADPTLRLSHSADGAVYHTLELINDGGGGFTLGLGSGSDPSSYDRSLSVTTRSSGASDVFDFTGSEGVTFDPPVFRIHTTVNGTPITHTGVTGTDGNGGEFVGGICTTLASAGASYSDEQAQDAVAAMIAAGTHSGITFSYNDGANSLSATVTVSGYTDEQAQDAVGGILTNSNTLSLSYNDSTPAIAGAVIYQLSITADSSGIKLINDTLSPGNSQYYGTDGGGTKGWYSLPSSYTDEQAQDAVGTILVDTDTVDLAYNDGTPSITATVKYGESITAVAGTGLKLSGDSASPGNIKYYGTDGGGTKGWYNLYLSGRVLGYSYVDTAQSTTSSTPVDLTTAQSITFSLDATADVLVMAFCEANSTVTAVMRIYADVDGSDTTLNSVQHPTANGQCPLCGSCVVNLASGSHTIKLQFSTNTSTATFRHRNVVVMLLA